MACDSSAARAALTAFPAMVSPLDLCAANESELQVILTEVRAAQRCLEGLAIRIAGRSNELEQGGVSAPATEAMRGRGSASARQARREAARAEVAAEVSGVEDAVTTGRISGEHVDSIARHMLRLSDERRAAVDFEALIEQATVLPAETFDRLVKRHVDRAAADYGLADTKAKQAASEFRHWFDHEAGMGRFAGSLDPERYEAVVTALDQRTASLAAATGSSVQKNRHLASQALVELIINSGGAHDARNRLPSILVVVDWKTAVGGPHDDSVCQTEQGHDISAQSAARLCCDAVVRQITLDDSGVPINVGRRHRTATDGQWAAIKTLHSTCAWEGCTAPINWCQAHHIREWERGGKTDLNNLIPLCSRHHHRVHEGQWRIALLADRSLKIFKPGGSHYRTVPTPMRC